MTTHRDELDLHRNTVDEAIPRLDSFLHSTFQAGLRRVWVVHGKGTGTLRHEVARHLSRHSLVKSFRPADRFHGGAGATEVQLSDR